MWWTRLATVVTGLVITWCWCWFRAGHHFAVVPTRRLPTTEVGGAVGALTVCAMAGAAFAAGGTLSMLGVAIFAGVLGVQYLAHGWLDPRRASEEAGCLIGLVPIALTVGGAVVVYRIGSSNYDDPEALTRTGFVQVTQGAAMVATVFWLRFARRSERLDVPSPWRSGWAARYETPGYVLAPALAWLALVIAIVGVLSTLADGVGGDAAAACFIAVVMVVWAGAQFY